MEACPKRPIEMQVASLMKKFEAVVVENRMLKQELDKSKKVHQQSLDQVKQELNETKKEHQRSLDGVKQEVVDLKQALHQQKEKLQSHSIPLPVPPFYFSVSNFQHYQSNELPFFSESFYSHPGGYKMEVEIHPNGFTDARGTHMSLYVVILRGEFDDQLRWPFDGSITVQAYNRTTERWSNDHTITMNKAICAKEVERCVDKVSQGGCGYPNFLSLSDLKDNYLKSTVFIHFRVTSVEFAL
jgi:TNF receptor-associated factor 4